jgi:DNA mismatch repair protein MLH1
MLWRLRVQVLLPSLRLFLKPPKHRARDGSIILLTSMERLYRVFERCG